MTRVPLDQYRKNLEQLIERCRAVGSQVVLCTPNAVIDTPDRPIEKLVAYCDVVRAVGRDRGAPVCDQYAAGLSLRARAPWTWRMTMSDAIHPNMDGHKRMAEELCHTISGRRISLDAVEPSRPALGWTRKELSAGQTVDVLVMEPLAELFPKAINAAVVKRIPSAAKSDSSRIQFKAWPVEGKSLSELEQAAKAQVRAMKPDLVVLTLPSKAIEIAPRAGESKSAADERLVASFSWLMNWSLSFGTRQWDCVVIHPSLVGDSLTSEQDWLLRRLVRAQHLFLLERQAGDTESSEAILQRWIEEDWGRAPNAHP